MRPSVSLNCPTILLLAVCLSTRKKISFTSEGGTNKTARSPRVSARLLSPESIFAAPMTPIKQQRRVTGGHGCIQELQLSAGVPQGRSSRCETDECWENNVFSASHFRSSRWRHTVINCTAFGLGVDMVSVDLKIFFFCCCLKSYENMVAMARRALIWTAARASNMHL